MQKVTPSSLSGGVLVGSERSYLLHIEPRGQNSVSLQHEALNVHILQLVDGGAILAGLLHAQLGLDLLCVIYQTLADWSLGLQILVSLTDQCLLLDLTLNAESQMIVQLLADWPLDSQVLVVGPGLRLLHVLLLPLLHGGLVGLLVVRDGLDDVLPPPGDRLEVAPDLALVRHG